MSELVIRAAEVRDIGTVMELAGRSPGAPVWSEATWEQVFASSAGQTHRVILVAESDGEPVGFGVAGAAADEAQIESLAVSANARRKRVGTSLCEAMFEWARGRGAVQILLEVRASNVAAQAVYCSLGFTEQAVRRQYYREPVEDAVLMARTL